MALRIVTAPTVEPVTLAEVRLQMGKNQTTDTTRDTIITARIKAARLAAEAFTRRALITQTWDLYADCFEETHDLMADLQTVTFVKYTDEAGVVQTMATTDYQVDTISHRVVRGYNLCWPLTRRVPNAVQIRHVSGYGLAVSVPEDIKEAIKFTVGHWEKFQSGIEGGVTMTRIPFAVEHLLGPYRDFRGAT